MLSAIGLTLDLVGAVALVLGLFGHARALYPGYSVRSPDDVAHDEAFGIVGALFLAFGFFLQSLTYFGIRVDCSVRATTIAASVTLISGSGAACLLYGLLYVPLQRREVRHIRSENGEAAESYPMRTFRRGFRFWLGKG